MKYQEPQDHFLKGIFFTQASDKLLSDEYKNTVYKEIMLCYLWSNNSSLLVSSNVLLIHRNVIPCYRQFIFFSFTYRPLDDQIFNGKALILVEL